MAQKKDINDKIDKYSQGIAIILYVLILLYALLIR